MQQLFSRREVMFESDYFKKYCCGVVNSEDDNKKCFKPTKTYIISTPGYTLKENICDGHKNYLNIVHPDWEINEEHD